MATAHPWNLTPDRFVASRVLPIQWYQICPNTFRDCNENYYVWSWIPDQKAISAILRYFTRMMHLLRWRCHGNGYPSWSCMACRYEPHLIQSLMIPNMGWFDKYMSSQRLFPIRKARLSAVLTVGICTRVFKVNSRSPMIVSTADWNSAMKNHRLTRTVPNMESIL